MIVYSASRAEFTDDVLSNRIEKRILDAFALRLGRRTSRTEVVAWQNSMQYMNNVLTSAATPDDASVAIEYQVALTSKRVAFILAGADDRKRETAVIVELKKVSREQHEIWGNTELAKKPGRDGFENATAAISHHQAPLVHAILRSSQFQNDQESERLFVTAQKAGLSVFEELAHGWDIRPVKLTEH